MSNRSESYMLNVALCAAEEIGIFDKIGKSKTIEYAKKLIAIGDRHVCNSGEILD